MAEYVKEPSYCGDCVSFVNEYDGYGSCGKDGAEAWQGEIACKYFKKKEDEDDE